MNKDFAIALRYGVGVTAHAQALAAMTLPIAAVYRQGSRGDKLSELGLVTFRDGKAYTLPIFTELNHAEFERFCWLRRRVLRWYGARDPGIDIIRRISRLQASAQRANKFLSHALGFNTARVIRRETLERNKGKRGGIANELPAIRRQIASARRVLGVLRHGTEDPALRYGGENRAVVGPIRVVFNLAAWPAPWRVLRAGGKEDPKHAFCRTIGAGRTLAEALRGARERCDAEGDFEGMVAVQHVREAVNCRRWTCNW